MEKKFKSVAEYDAEVAEYDAEIKDVRYRIKKMREAGQRGGGVIDWEGYELDLQKKKVFLQASNIAKEKDSTKVVERMINSAKKVTIFHKNKISDNLKDLVSFSFAGSVVAAAGVYTAAPAVAVGGALALLGTVAYCTYKDAKLTKSQRDLTALKEYAKDGDMDRAVKVAQKTEKPSIAERLVAKFKQNFFIK